MKIKFIDSVIRVAVFPEIGRYAWCPGDEEQDLVFSNIANVQEIGSSGATGYYVVFEFVDLAEMIETLPQRKKELEDIMVDYIEDDPN